MQFPGQHFTSTLIQQKKSSCQRKASLLLQLAYRISAKAIFSDIRCTARMRIRKGIVRAETRTTESPAPLRIRSPAARPWKDSEWSAANALLGSSALTIVMKMTSQMLLQPYLLRAKGENQHRTAHWTNRSSHQSTLRKKSRRWNTATNRRSIKAKKI